MAIINFGPIGLHDQGVHISSKVYKRLARVQHPTTGARYIAYRFDVPSGVELSNAGYWRYEDSGVASLQATVQANAEAITEVVGFVVPLGGIIMWGGDINTIPSGWALCDGQNGTPDLRDRFVVGAGSTYGKGATGGSKDAVLVSHSHSINHNHPNASTTYAGNHAHAYVYKGAAYKAGANGGALYAWFNTQTTSSYTGGNHRHNLDVPNFTGNSGANGVSGAGRNLPPYYALAFIIKI